MYNKRELQNNDIDYRNIDLLLIPTLLSSRLYYQKGSHKTGLIFTEYRITCNIVYLTVR